MLNFKSIGEHTIAGAAAGAVLWCAYALTAARETCATRAFGTALFYGTPTRFVYETCMAEYSIALALTGAAGCGCISLISALSLEVFKACRAR